MLHRLQKEEYFLVRRIKVLNIHKNTANVQVVDNDDDTLQIPIYVIVDEYREQNHKIKLRNNVNKMTLDILFTCFHTHWEQLNCDTTPVTFS